jgi:hypothetical protein
MINETEKSALCSKVGTKMKKKIYTHMYISLVLKEEGNGGINSVCVFIVRRLSANVAILT